MQAHSALTELALLKYWPDIHTALGIDRSDHDRKRSKSQLASTKALGSLASAGAVRKRARGRPANVGAARIAFRRPQRAQEGRARRNRRGGGVEQKIFDQQTAARATPSDSRNAAFAQRRLRLTRPSSCGRARAAAPCPFGPGHAGLPRLPRPSPVSADAGSGRAKPVRS